ncbi:glycosyltransferase family 4 protein [Brevundimonas sp. SORGH_AS_0993]|uniref:glycosyltransferase family 4 protein n=1 Tax=Brevundimonas sp. SORGH_AS_0993 TaxID=3041794 RepID=UPI002783167A|nr:glycosyltransferase family 4 protein [Brevundimonas sp. SORGH_AS_0993]MDQ1153660.1 glycosyltransferase involved in cell wall biosynthesis [Brevundimonas sp. SORGH_AS_0993]
MENVALTLSRHSRFRDETRFICEAGAANPAAPDLTITVPAGLGKADHSRAVLQTLQDFDPDLVEYHQTLGCAADFARRLPGARHVLYRHTRIRPPRHLIDRMRYRGRLRGFDRLIFVSQAARTEFLTDYPGFDDRASVVCNPIDLACWRGDPAEREKLILFSGRAMAEKGLDAFCAALAVVLDRHRDWRGALMLGDWDQHGAWAAQHVETLSRFGDRIEVRRSAPLDVVRDVTRRAAIAVVPSRVAEAMGLTALEAHAAGAALISSGRGGLREASGLHALYVDPPEADALAQAMLRLVADHPGRIAMAQDAQAFVGRTHAPQTRADELDRLRTEMMAQRVARFSA